MRLTEKLYYYPWQGRANNCNSYLYNGLHTILFDPGHIMTDLREDCLEMLSGQLAADGFNFSDIDYILCTHGHPDHVESAGIVREKSGARLAMHRADDFMVEMIARHSHRAEGLQPDIDLVEGPLLLGEEDDGETLQVLHTPGHSPGCVCFYLPTERALISGDTVFEGSIGRADLPGGDMAVLGRSVEKIARFGGVDTLLPGHMGIVRGAENVEQNLEQIQRMFF